MGDRPTFNLGAAALEGTSPVAVLQPQPSSRHLMRREIAATKSEAPVAQALSTTDIAAAQRGHARATSFVDNTEALVAQISALRSERAQARYMNIGAGAVLSTVVHFLSPEARQELLALVPDASRLKLLGAQLLSKLFPQKEANLTRSKAQTEEHLQTERDAAHLQTEEEEEATLSLFGRLKRDTTSALSFLLEKLELITSRIGGFVGKACRNLLSFLDRVVGRKSKESTTREGSDSILPILTPTHYSDSTASHTRPPVMNDWQQRFGDDPKEGVKAVLQAVVKTLEEFGESQRQRQEKRAHELCEETTREQDRLNRLREALAKLLNPCSDGSIPLLLLSRHFVGEWVTTNDLLAAIARAQAARHNVDC